jgi:histidine triad (HIT) family protein
MSEGASSEGRARSGPSWQRGEGASSEGRARSGPSWQRGEGASSEGRASGSHRPDPDCLFCKIVAGEIPADVVYRDDRVLAFRDIAPKAPIHVLVIPHGHFADVVELGTDREASADLLAGVSAVARQLELPYFTTVFNTGAESGQTVMHVHAHLLGGSGAIWAHGS